MMKYLRCAYEFEDIAAFRETALTFADGILTLADGGTLELPLEPVHYGECVIINALAMSSSGGWGQAYVSLRLFRGRTPLDFPTLADETAGSYQFFGTGMRDYRYRFVIPQFCTRAVVTIRARGTTLTFRHLETYACKEQPDILPIVGGTKFVAHLGMIGLAPRNTMAAFTLAKRAGYRECVTNMNGTKDGKLVALHNDTIDDTANGTGSVYDYTLDELRQFDFGGKFHPLYSGEPIPTLDEVLGFMAHSGLRPVLRLSSNFTGDKHAYLETLYDLVRQKGLFGHCTAKGFSRTVLTELSQMAGDRFRYGYCGANKDFTQEDCDWLKSLGRDVYLDVNYKALTPELIALAQKNDIALEVWIINDFQRIVELTGMGVTGFTTDFYNLDGCSF